MLLNLTDIRFADGVLTVLPCDLILVFAAKKKPDLRTFLALGNRFSLGLSKFPVTSMGLGLCAKGGQQVWVRRTGRWTQSSSPDFGGQDWAPVFRAICRDKKVNLQSINNQIAQVDPAMPKRNEVQIQFQGG